MRRAPSRNGRSESRFWPIDEGLIAMTGFIVAGVASGIVVRFIISAAHL